MSITLGYSELNSMTRSLSLPKIQTAQCYPKSFGLFEKRASGSKYFTRKKDFCHVASHVEGRPRSF